MKSTDGQPKPRGRPPGRKIKIRSKNLSPSENENKKTISHYFSPTHTTTAAQEQDETKESGSTPRRKKNPLANLQSNLSPKYIGFGLSSSAEKRRSRYRITKPNNSSTYFRSNRGLIGCVRRTTVNGSLRSPLSSPEMFRRSASFISPIDKLLRKNGAMKSLPCSPIRGFEIFGGEERSDEFQNKKKNCVVRMEQIIRNEIMAEELSDDEENSETNIESNGINETVKSEVMCSLMEVKNLVETENTSSPVQKSQRVKKIAGDEIDKSVKQKKAIIGNLNSEFNLHDGIDPFNGNNNNSGSRSINMENEQILHLHESKFSNDELPSIKSPSTFSVDSAKGSSLDNDLNWVSIETGDLFWGQIFQFSYWPCIVCPDPEGKTISVNDGRGNMQHVMIHVRFFADNGRRSWVKRDNLMPFAGIEAYMKKMQETEQKYGKRSPKYKIFIVSRSKTRLWNQAVKEAEIIDSIATEDRLEKFFELVEEVRIYNSLERKRRQSMYLHSSTSDISSMFDSTDTLYLKQPVNKRDRSPTPISPAYSPLGPKNSEKRRKLNGEQSRSGSSSLITMLDEPEENSEVQTSELTPAETLQRVHTDIYSDIEFKKFTSAMRAFILENSSDPKLETQFLLNVRSMWALKHITARNRMESNPKFQTTPNGVKRLSQRIRNISIQKSLPSTPAQPIAQAEHQPVEKSKHKKTIVRPIEEVIEDIFQLDSKYLFRGVSKDPVCSECLKPGTDLYKCSRNCQSWSHVACSANYLNESPNRESDAALPQILHITGDLDESSLSKVSRTQAGMASIVCKQCESGESTKCFVCKKDDPELGELGRCNSQHCGKLFHLHCLRYWPQAKITKSAGKLEKLRCPAHVCHTCVSDDPKGKFLQIEKSKLTKCIKCPATYHMDSTCIPAGSQFLSAAWIICPRHSKQQEPFINVNWCFICVSGGNLVCCETCPTAVHAECLKIPVAEEGYICEECETGRMPLYGEMVWAKFNNFRWWPSLILPPPEVPENLARKTHNQSEFVIRFFGTNDHAWISRRRVYLYQEGDCSEPPRNQKKGLDYNYIKGVEEAKRIADIIKEKKELMRANDKKQRISPLPYVKIKSNRAVPPLKLQVDLEKISKCECDKDSKNPCGQDSGCLNRVLFTECNPKICPAGDRCQNQLFEKKVYPKLDVAYMNEKGFGLICLEPISAGTFVIEYVGEVIDDAEFRRRIAQKEQERDENFYFLTLEKDYIIDAGPKGNLARFMNHSCDPNCETQKWSVNGLNRIGLFAIKDIPKNSELTFNYFWDELLGNEKKSCHCGAEKCAGLIGGKYKQPVRYFNSQCDSKHKEFKSVQTKQPQGKIQVKRKKTISKPKLKSPKQARKLKVKAAAMKSDKTVKRTPRSSSSKNSSLSLLEDVSLTDRSENVIKTSDVFLNSEVESSLNTKLLANINHADGDQL